MVNFKVRQWIATIVLFIAEKYVARQNEHGKINPLFHQ